MTVLIRLALFPLSAGRDKNGVRSAIKAELRTNLTIGLSALPETVCETIGRRRLRARATTITLRIRRPVEPTRLS
jgi:hypothetical protein